MHYPNFYNKIENIKLQDNLSDFLGSFEEGIIEFSYLDIVKIAGHSCPTVLGAYLMSLEGLKALYPLELPRRGEIKVEFKESITDGTTGVVANVIGIITGATINSGFKGISGSFDRRNLLLFDKEISSNVKFTRVDTQGSIEVFYDHSIIPFDEKIQILMKKIIQKLATKEEKNQFRRLWQERVNEISNNIKRVIKII